MVCYGTFSFITYRLYITSVYYADCTKLMKISYEPFQAVVKFLK